MNAEQDAFKSDFPGEDFKKFRQQLKRIAKSEHAVLLTGESGTGKSRLARSIHDNSNRRSRDFVEISCASIPSQLLESELFGYCKGAFSGAFKNKVGLFEKADSGTVFLDEIGEMPLELQPKLLLFLQNQRFYPVGSEEQRTVDVRLIAATNQNLHTAMAEGNFRQDLYYRLNVFELELLPLRERPGEIPVMALQFLSEALGVATIPGFSNEALDRLLHYDWPGNIRELKNTMLRVATLVDGDERVQVDHLPKQFEGSSAESSDIGYNLSGKRLDEVERDTVKLALKENSGNRKVVAEKLGISEKTVYNLIKRHQLS